MLTIIPNAYATDEFHSDEGYVIPHSDRPAINPDFDPDYSCIFDAYQLKCIPGSQQDCHEVGFGNNDDATCFPYEFITEGRPKGYHSIDDDETGQCYPNSQEYPDHGSDYPTMVLLEDRLGKGGESGSDQRSSSLQRIPRGTGMTLKTSVMIGTIILTFLTSSI
jgi:hypothetical protein